MSKRTILIVMDAEPNTIKNRLIRLIQHWETVTTNKKLTTPFDIIHYIYHEHFNDVTDINKCRVVAK